MTPADPETNGSVLQALGERLLAAALGVVMLLVLFAVAEVTLRLTGRGVAPEAADAAEAAPGFLTCDKDSLLGWIFPPSVEGVFHRGAWGVVERTNRWGLRSPEIRETERDVTRILVLGDSFTFGWAVEESQAFPRRLEHLLGLRHPGRRIEVVNAGIPGFSLYQQSAMLARLLDGLRVHAVISTFSLSNDMVDELRIRRYVPDRLLLYSPGSRAPGSTLARAIAASRVLTWIDQRTLPLQYQAANVSPRSVRYARESLERIATLCERRKVPLMLVLVPRRTEVVAEGTRRWVLSWLMSGARRMFARVAAERGLPSVDLGPALTAANAGAPAFLPNDLHWTPSGHEAVAAAILPAAESLIGAGD